MPCIGKRAATDKRRGFIWRSVVAAVASACLISAPTLAGDHVPQNDLLNAELWIQTAIEYRANCLTVYALAKVRLGEAVADRNWTAYDQSGSYQNLPPAVIIDLDETAIDNSAYEAGLVVDDTRFNPRTWDDWTKAEQAKAVPGAVEFANYAAAKGVKVFYVSNRNAESEGGHQAQSRGAWLSNGRQRRHFAYAKGQARMVHGRQGFTFRLYRQGLPRVADVR